jgi:hypothetical protein
MAVHPTAAEEEFVTMISLVARDRGQWQDSPRLCIRYTTALRPSSDGRTQ